MARGGHQHQRQPNGNSPNIERYFPPQRELVIDEKHNKSTTNGGDLVLVVRIKDEKKDLVSSTDSPASRQKENVPDVKQRPPLPPPPQPPSTKKRPQATTRRRKKPAGVTGTGNAATGGGADANNDTKAKFITDYFTPRRSHRRTKAEVLKSKRMLMEDKVLQADESGFEVVTFADKGRGVVSNDDLKAGDYVLEYAGDLIDLKEARRREEMYANDSSVGCYMYYFQHENRSHCIDATRESERLGRLINHSIKGANLKTKSVTIGGKPRLVFLAKRDIECGEELLYDYGDRSKQSLQSHPWLKN